MCRLRTKTQFANTGSHDVPKNIHHNAAPSKEPLPPVASREAVLSDFAKRLQEALRDKGWNQSELARQASKFMADEKFGRYNVSEYIRGKSIPSPHYLSAMAKALGVKPEALLPTQYLPSVDTKLPPLEVKDAGSGNAWLRVNQSVPWEVAIEVMKMIRRGQVEK